MKLEIPVNKKAYEQIKERMAHSYGKSNRDSVFFTSTTQDDVLFVLAHGGHTEDNIGFVQIKNKFYTPEEVLNKLMTQKNFNKDVIKEVVIICCHPGYMQPYELNGIKIYSFHDTLEEINSRAVEYINEYDEIEYSLEVFVN